MDTSNEAVPAPGHDSGELRELARTVDERLAELFKARHEEVENRVYAEEAIRGAADQEKVRSARRQRWVGTLDDALAAKPTTPWAAKTHAEAIARRSLALARLELIEQEIAEGVAMYNEFRWNRAFLVTSSDGHVHKTMDCPTCRLTTEFTWLPQYSGAKEDEIVGDAGETACTVCYPTAPADVLNRPSCIVTTAHDAKKVARAERQAAKAARDVKRKAAAATASGEALVIPEQFSNQTETVQTERAARIEWNRSRESSAELSSPWWLERAKKRMAIIENALAEKHGVSPEAIRADLESKYSKRRQ